MTLLIGKANLTGDARVTSTSEGKNLHLELSIFNDIQDHKESLKEVFFHSDMVSESNQATGNLYIDTSRFHVNTIYVSITDKYEGWAIPINRPTVTNYPNLTTYSIDLYKIDDYELQDYAVSIECEDNITAGTKTADASCSNNYKVTYTCAVADTEVIGTGPLFLPDGDYKVELHCRSNTTKTNTFKATVGGVAGGAVTNTDADTWGIISLGVFTISDPLNTLEINVADATNTNTCSLDVITITKEVYEYQYRARWDYALWG